MLEFIFITVVVIWLVGLLGRWFLRWWLVKKQRELSERFGGGAGQTRGRGAARRGNRPEGDVSVRQTAPVQKKVNKSVGDYVEFEEVEITEETVDGQ